MRRPGGRLHAGTRRLAGALILVLAPLAAGQRAASDVVLGGAHQRTPSRAMYFDWINSQYEGTTEAHTLTNLAFWRWMHDEYGMQLDVYSLDVGNVDDGPYTAGVGRLIPDHHGDLETPEFRAQFPRGFAPLQAAAAEFGCRLGIWLGPDGFGETPAEEAARADLLLTLCRDFDFALLKLDTVAGRLRPEKRAPLARALARCREVQPDLIVLSERVDLGEHAHLATTELWEGAETYVDVFEWNPTTGPHHRVGGLTRPNTPGLERRLEDHGVCLSSCLDAWEDDLVLQAFGRALLLAPELYGNPWFLRDDELARLARLCNLQRRLRELLVDGMRLPADRYGPHAVARGDGRTRVLVLRNPTWAPVRYSLRLDASIGLEPVGSPGTIELRRFHPREEVLGSHPFGAEIAVEVEPFRAALFVASAAPPAEVGVAGCEFEVVRDVPGRPVELRLLGEPGTRAEVTLAPGARRFARATLDGRDVSALTRGEAVSVAFAGEATRAPWHARLGVLEPCAVPPDAAALVEATCFAADSDALELRSLARAGATEHAAVAAARDAFLAQPMLVNRGLAQRFLFDGDLGTYFHAQREGGALRLDLGADREVDRIVLRAADRESFEAGTELHRFAEGCRAEISRDLRSWQPVGSWSGVGTIAVAELEPGTRVRYLRVTGAPRRLAEVDAYLDGAPLDRAAWRASNLFAPPRPVAAAWSGTFRLGAHVPGAFLAVALDGRHGAGAAWVAGRVDGRLVGCPDRAPSFPANTWEYRNVSPAGDTTWYLPLTPEMAERDIEVFVLLQEGGAAGFEPTVYRTAHGPPRTARRLVLE